MATYPGTSGNDTLTGTQAEDTFVPLGGSDIITGGGGFDALDYKTSPGPVTVNLASGVAQDGYGGTDRFTGISVVFGSASGDTLTGTTGLYQTRLIGRAGNDVLNGVVGSSFSVAAGYQDSPAPINANLGTGVVQDGWGTTDTLVNIFSVQGSAFDDTMLGGVQNDRFRGDGGNDVIDGGGGTGNRADYTDAVTGVVVDLAAGTAQDGQGGVDTLIRIQNIGGSANADTLLGDSADNFFLPAQGSDTVDGRGGYNTVSYDYFVTTPLTAGVVGNLTTGIVTEPGGTRDTLLNIQGLYGTTFADDLTGRDVGATRSNLRGLQGNDILRAPTPGTRVTADYRADPAAVTVNLLLGRATDGWGGTDTLVNINSVQGSAYSDTITGGSGNDYLDGNEGDDQLLGGDGDDLLVGDTGNDIMDGGAGFDTVISTGLGFRDKGILARTSATEVVQTRGAQVDTWRNIEQITFLDGRLVYGDTDPAAQVTRLYQAALGRTADQGGLNFWIGNIQRGVPLANLATEFLSSAEFTARFGANLDNGAFVTRIYQNVLGRDPEAGGLNFWRGELDNGARSRGDVLAGISESTENKAGTAALVQAGIWDANEAAQQVARLYDTALGRLPDVGGLTYWKDAIEAGTQSLQDLAQAFVGSAEFVASYGALGNQAFVEKVYANTLGRPGDAGGVAFWTGQLDGGVSRAQVTIGFSESAEHQARTAANVGGETPDTYGIRFA